MSRRTILFLYMAAVFLYWMSLYLYVPTLPTYTQSKVDDLAVVGTVASMYGLWQAIIRLPLGIASDWLGWRKPFILAGFVLAGLGAYIMGTASGIQGLIVGRAITGLAAGTWVPLVVVFNSQFSAHDAVKATSLLTLVGSAGQVLATGATGSLNEWGGYSLPFFLAIGAAGLALVTVLPAHEVRRPPRTPSVAGIVALITRRDVLLPAILSLLNQYVTWSTVFAFIPVLAKEFGASDPMLSLLVSLNLGVMLVGNLLTTSIVGKFGAQKLAYATFAFAGTGLAGLVVARSLPVVFVAQLCIGLAQGIGAPVFMGMSIRHVDDQERTTAMGLHQSVYAIGMFAGPWLSGILARALGIQPTFAITTVVIVGLGLLGARWLQQADVQRVAA